MCLLGHPCAIIHPTATQRAPVSHRFRFLCKPFGRNLSVEVREGRGRATKDDTDMHRAQLKLKEELDKPKTAEIACLQKR